MNIVADGLDGFQNDVISWTTRPWQYEPAFIAYVVDEYDCNTLF